MHTFYFKKIKKIMGRNVFSDQFGNIMIHQNVLTMILNVMRQSACFVNNPITVDKSAALFNCMPVDRASVSISLLGSELLCLLLGPPGLN